MKRIIRLRTLCGCTRDIETPFLNMPHVFDVPLENRPSLRAMIDPALPPKDLMRTRRFVQTDEILTSRDAEIVIYEEQ